MNFLNTSSAMTRFDALYFLGCYHFIIFLGTVTYVQCWGCFNQNLDFFLSACFRCCLQFLTYVFLISDHLPPENQLI